MNNLLIVLDPYLLYGLKTTNIRSFFCNTSRWKWYILCVLYVCLCQIVIITKTNVDKLQQENIVVFCELFQQLCRKSRIHRYVREHTYVWVKLVLYFHNLQKCFSLHNCAKLRDVGQVWAGVWTEKCSIRLNVVLVILKILWHFFFWVLNKETYVKLFTLASGLLCQYTTDFKPCALNNLHFLSNCRICRQYTSEWE
jgi:hypothetical protein